MVIHCEMDKFIVQNALADSGTRKSGVAGVETDEYGILELRYHHNY